jgi:hypothetical protein
MVWVSPNYLLSKDRIDETRMVLIVWSTNNWARCIQPKGYNNYVSRKAFDCQKSIRTRQDKTRRCNLELWPIQVKNQKTRGALGNMPPMVSGKQVVVHKTASCALTVWWDGSRHTFEQAILTAMRQYLHKWCMYVHYITLPGMPWPDIRSAC